MESKQIRLLFTYTDPDGIDFLCTLIKEDDVFIVERIESRGRAWQGEALEGLDELEGRILEAAHEYYNGLF